MGLNFIVRKQVRSLGCHSCRLIGLVEVVNVTEFLKNQKPPLPVPVAGVGGGVSCGVLAKKGTLGSAGDWSQQALAETGSHLGTLVLIDENSNC